MPSKDVLEIKALDTFKQEWKGLGFTTTIPTGGEKMPRRQYAYAMAATFAQLCVTYEAQELAAHSQVLAAMLQTVLGNSSQLGAKLMKEGWLKEASPEVTADALLEALKARIAK